MTLLLRPSGLISCHGLGFFSGEDEKAVKHFRTYADNMREDFRFALTTNADVLEEYGYKE